ncbi:MAG TPA: hypothetical protein VFC21_13080 [Bryobacteraceae bacterium]|nr:hypothetical protein [Bryobacteraceae bacterium]
MQDLNQLRRDYTSARKTTPRGSTFQNARLSYGLDWKDKKYLEPWEIREIDTDEFLLFAVGKNGGHRAARRSYLDTPEFTGKYSPDPYR